MRRASVILLPLLVLLWLSNVSSARTAPRGGDRKWLVDGSCRLASTFDGRFSKEYCTSVLRSAPFDDKVKLSLHGLAWVSLNALISNVTATKGKLEKMSEFGGQGRPALENAVKHCTSMYKEAFHRATDALKFMEEHKYTEADRTVSMIQGDGSECETAFTSEPGLVSPLTKDNLDTQYLSAITTLLIRFFDRSYTPWGVPILKNPISII